jgi:sigma-B regulation protein RsbU (phosphoserine phosphatase)
VKPLKSPQKVRSGLGSPPNFKALYRKIEITLDKIQEQENIEKVFAQVVTSLVKNFEDELGFVAGRLYQRDEANLQLCSLSGDPAETPHSLGIPVDYPPVRLLMEEGLIIMGEGDPGFDRRIESPIGVTTFAAIAVGDGNTHVMAFSIRGEIREEQILYSLSTIRHVINMKLREERLSGPMNESRQIQESLLPSAPPQFPGYDIDGRSRPTEIVGGDLFDYIQLSPNLLGVAVADASGHGLPAALLARDVITGLRIGMAEDLKIIKTIEKLNSVIHRSALSSKFASLFYGELETNGNFIYSNAGHAPPLLVRGEVFEELRQGGMVLGPVPNAHYVRGYVHLCPGDTVVMFTDGFPECENNSGDQLEMPRLKKIIRDLEDSTAGEMVDGIFAAADEFAGGTHQNDDMTVVVIRKL